MAPRGQFSMARDRRITTALSYARFSEALLCSRSTANSVSAGDHFIAVLKFNAATVHLATSRDAAKLTFAAIAIPGIDVRIFFRFMASLTVFSFGHDRLSDR